MELDDPLCAFLLCGDCRALEMTVIPNVPSHKKFRSAATTSTKRYAVGGSGLRIIEIPTDPPPA